MLEALTGTGLAAAAGLNAYIPLLAVGLLSRTDLVELPAGWAWLGNGWVLVVVAVLLVIEIVADKIPAVDSVNDIVQTVVRPASGGIVFGSGSTAETVSVTDPSTLFQDDAWVPIVVGIVIALAFHALKATVRPVANAGSVGVAAPILSTVEDVVSIALSILALLVPVLAVLLLVVVIVLGVRIIRRRRRRGTPKAGRGMRPDRPSARSDLG